jgi:3-oxoacyl-(acyl-carrier-protein) synthase
MPRNNDVNSIIVPAQSPNLTAHTYTTIYGGSSGCTATINGVSVSVGAASSIDIAIRTISNGTGCYLLGENQNVYLGSPNLP